MNKVNHRGPNLDSCETSVYTLDLYQPLPICIHFYVEMKGYIQRKKDTPNYGKHTFLF